MGCIGLSIGYLLQILQHRSLKSKHLHVSYWNKFVLLSPWLNDKVRVPICVHRSATWDGISNKLDHEDEEFSAGSGGILIRFFNYIFWQSSAVNLPLSVDFKAVKALRLLNGWADLEKFNELTKWFLSASFLN